VPHLTGLYPKNLLIVTGTKPSLGVPPAVSWPPKAALELRGPEPLPNRRFEWFWGIPSGPARNLRKILLGQNRYSRPFEEGFGPAELRAPVAVYKSWCLK